MCILSLKGSSGLIGSGSFMPASDPLRFIPSGIQVAGSKPWFCRKKMMRLGDDEPVLDDEAPGIGDANICLGNRVSPNAAPAPVAIP